MSIIDNINLYYLIQVYKLDKFQCRRNNLLILYLLIKIGQ
jgi:hypothetical protein